MNLLLLLLLLQCAELCAAYRLRVSLGQGSPLVLPGGPPCGFGAPRAAACGGPSRMKGCLLHMLYAFSGPVTACPSSSPLAAATAETAALAAVPDPGGYSEEWALGTPGPSAEALSRAAQQAAKAAAPDFVSVHEQDSSLSSGKSSSSRVRLTLTLSNNHVYACITDKSRQHTFAFASSMDKFLRDSLPIVKRKKGKTRSMLVAASAARCCGLLLLRLLLFAGATLSLLQPLPRACVRVQQLAAAAPWLTTAAVCRPLAVLHLPLLVLRAQQLLLQGWLGGLTGGLWLPQQRWGLLYGGRVAALADAARKAGLEF
ncbi:hypothetical protein ACSSS7_004288 [Eimeria intestinalis]